MTNTENAGANYMRQYALTRALSDARWAQAPNPPKAVSEAQARLERAIEAGKEAKKELREAELALLNAEREDALAVEEAILSGKRVPEATTATEARQRVDNARAMEAARHNLQKRASEELVAVAFEHYPAWRRALLDDLQGVEAEAREALETLLRVDARRRELRDAVARMDKAAADRDEFADAFEVTLESYGRSVGEVVRAGIPHPDAPLFAGRFRVSYPDVVARLRFELQPTPWYATEWSPDESGKTVD